MTKTDAGRLLYKIFYLSLYLWGFEKGYSKFVCEMELETEHNWNILTPKLWPSALCLSSSLWLLNRSLGVCWVLAFLITTCLTPSTTFSPQLNCPSNSTVQFVGLILPSNSHAVIWTRLRNFFRYLATGMCHFRYLWNGLCDRHQAEITVMQFRGHTLPVRQSMRV